MGLQSDSNNALKKYNIFNEDKELFLRFDLQFFAEDGPTGQKTEDATPKQRQKQRREGNVLKSMEVNTVGVLMTGFIMLIMTKKIFMGNLIKYFNYIYRQLTMDISDVDRIMALYSTSLRSLAFITLPILFPVFIMAILVNIGQSGLLFTLKPLKPNMSKLNPASGLKKLFSMKKVVETIQAFGKLIIVAYFPINTVKNNFFIIVNTIKMPMYQGLGVIIDIITKIIWQVLFALVVIAVIDYLYQRYTYEKGIKMSKYDVKKEREEQEGKPEVKRAQKKKMFEILQANMMKELPKADVVITNPIHYAVAIKFDQEIDDIPIVIAKGALKLAQKIKDIAKENKIPIVENVEVARTLYQNCDVGDVIPEDFFKAVAEILAQVYKMKGKSY